MGNYWQELFLWCRCSCLKKGNKWNRVVCGFKGIFSVGFSLAIAKGISFIYRIIFAFFAETLIAHRPLYIGIYVFLIALGASSYFFLPGMTEKGYMWLEIVAYILGVIWFITDINTTKCASIINIWENKLGDVLCSHKTMYRSSNKKEMLLKT